MKLRHTLIAAVAVGLALCGTASAGAATVATTPSAAVPVAQAQVNALAGRAMMLHSGLTRTYADGMTSALYVATAPGTTYRPGTPGWFVTITGDAAQGYVSQVTRPSAEHVFEAPAASGSGATTNALQVEDYSCIGDPAQPQLHPGAYGYIGIWTVTDFLACNTPADYIDRLQLWEYELPEAESGKQWPPRPGGYTAVPLLATEYGYLMVNETSQICTGAGYVPWWSRQFTSVTWPSGYMDNNLPSGWSNTDFNWQRCSV